MLEEYKTLQPIVYRILKNAVLKNRSSHAYLFETKGYPKQLDTALAFAKFLLCPYHYENQKNCQDCHQCERIDDGNFTEIKIIEPDGMWIKKEQLEELQEEFSKKSVESTSKVYIINHAEKLNTSAANSILKFLEEPEENIYAILITDNLYQLLDTIISRCQIISFEKMKTNELIDQYQIENQTLLQVGSLLTDQINAFETYIQDAKNVERIEKTIKFVVYYELHGKETLLHMNTLWFDTWKEKEAMVDAFSIMILFYKDVLNALLNRPIEVMQTYLEEVEKIQKRNTVQTICQKLDVCIDAQKQIERNANINLLMDKLILSLERGNFHD